MTKAKHTEAPWIADTAEDAFGDIVIRGREVLHVAHVCRDSTSISDIEPIDEVEQKANAHLIAAAPIILRELDWCIAVLENKQLNEDEKVVLAAAKEASAKAKGEA